MKGLVFAEFSEVVEDRFGLALADPVLGASANKGWYGSGAHSEFGGLVEMVGGLSQQTSIPVETSIETAGYHLFARVIQAHPQVFVGCPTALDMLAQVERHIDLQVLELCPSAELPLFGVERDGCTLYMTCSSRGGLDELALGLIRGCLDHYETTGTIVSQSQNDAESVVRFEVTVDG